MNRKGSRYAFALALVSCLVPTAVGAQRGRGAEEVEGRADTVLGLTRSRAVRLTLQQEGPGLAVAQVASEGWSDLLVLEDVDLRAPGYELLVQREDGALVHLPGFAPRTVRGRLVGRPGSLVAGTLDEDGLTGRLVLPGEGELWIEPLAALVDGAPAGEHVLYDAADLDLPPLACGTAAAETGGGATATGDAPATSGAGTLRVAEVAFDADYEYFLGRGGVAEVESRILTVLNAVNLQYEAEVGIRHVVTTIVVRTSSSQPYTSTDASTLLNQFRSEWNTNQTWVQRDVAHLFTGKELAGSTIGIAWLSVVCNGSYGYGLSQSDFSSSFAAATDLTAHELGHNWSANHCSCPSYTMNPYITSANTFEPSLTIPTITAFRDSLGCLGTVDDGGTDPPPPADPAESLASADWATPVGTIVAGTYASTHVQDGVSEALQEASTGGRPSKRRSRLEHVWAFDVAAGGAYTFFLDAHHTPNAEGDDFLFAWSLDGSSWTPMLTVSRTVDDDSLQSFAFPLDVAGRLWVRATDTDATAGNGSLDTLFVDRMVVRVDVDGTDTTPPAPPTGLSLTPGDGSLALDWDDGSEADLAGWLVHRATSSGGPYATITPAPLAASELLDGGLANGTELFYLVTAVDTSGNESAPGPEVRGVPGAGGTTSCHVASILVSAESLGGGEKRGRADVWVADELGAPVAGAVVTGRFTGDLAEVLTATTDAQGLAVLLTTDSARGGLSLTFCVEDLAHAERNWASFDDQATCASR